VEGGGTQIDEVLELVPELQGAHAVSELAGGLTNTNYKVETEGGAYVDPTLASELVSPKATERIPALSTREREILGLLANGFSNPEIAARLFISPRTAETHRANLMRKLCLRSQTDLVRYAIDHGLIST